VRAGRIFVVIDAGEGVVSEASLEAMAWAQGLAAQAGTAPSAVLLGANVESAAQAARELAVEAVWRVEHQGLGSYDPDLCCEALRQFVAVASPDILVFPGDYRTLDFAPKLAAMLGRALLTDCIGFRADGTDLLFVRRMFQGKLDAEVSLGSAFPWLVTVQRGAERADAVRRGQAQAPVLASQVALDGLVPRRVVLDESDVAEGHVDLSTADTIVAVGRGIGRAENLGIVRELAAVLGAEIGATRPVVDADWLERDRQIGSSGQAVSPKLYVACGISGAIYHVVGMRQAKCIVAIDTDPHAPIFNVATYGIVGDVLEVVPALTRRLAALRSGSSTPS